MRHADKRRSIRPIRSRRLVRLIPLKRLATRCLQTRWLPTLRLPITGLPITSLPIGGRSLGGITSLRLAKQSGSGGWITREGGPFRG
jgi:hypothetical protein